MSEWLSPSEAAALIQRHVGGSIGRSEALAKAAIASGEVRCKPLILLTADDGIIGMDLRPGAMELANTADLFDWLDRRGFKEGLKQKNPQVQRGIPKHRNPGDAILLKEGRKMVAKGKSKRKTAELLAHRATGGSYEQKVERLRKLL
jgi:hypothetical protein